MEHKGTTVVDETADEVLYLTELEVDFVREYVEKVSADPFLKVNITKQAPKIKKKLNVLRKKAEGTDGTSSKYEDPERINGYGIFEIAIPPYDLDALASLYDESAILRAVVEARTMNTVGLGSTWEPTSKAEKRTMRASADSTKADRVRSDHQREIDNLNTTFEGFNVEDTLIETLIKVWIDYLSLGNGYLEVGRNRSGKIGYLGHIPAKYVRIRKEKDGFIQLTASAKRAIFFRNFGEDTADPTGNDDNPNEIIHFKMYSPNNTYYGIPPAVSAISAIIGDKFAKEYNIDYFENKAIPRYAIILKGVKLSEKSKKELIAYFKNEVKGKNHGTLVIPLPAAIGNTDADIKFEKLEDGIQDMSFDKYRSANRDEVATAYRVPPTKVAIFSNANLAVSRDADKTFKVQVCGPDQVIAEKKINRIVKEFTDLFTFNLVELDMIDEDIESRILDRYLRTEVITPNEARQEIGKPPIDGGDDVLPYATKVKKETDDKTLKLQEKQLDANIKAAKETAKTGGGVGNTNAQGGSPQKSGHDNGSNRSSTVATGTSGDRGSAQDAKGVRERKT